MTRAEAYRETAEAALRWVLDQVRWDDGPWVPWSVTDPPVAEPPWDRDGLHSGTGGLAHLLAEVRATRAWTDEEEQLAGAVAERVRGVVPEQQDCTFFDGLPSTIGVLLALGADGAADAVDRLSALASSDGWPQSVVQPPRYLPGARVNDLTLGTAGVLLAALWARRHGVPRAGALAARAADVLVAEGEEVGAGLLWRMVPARFRTDEDTLMPNLSHGQAGIAAALALAGAELGRPDLVDAAVAGAEHLLTLGDVSGGGFRVPREVPRRRTDLDEVTYTWCHGPTGTSLLFGALDTAGVTDVAGEPPLAWHRRCLTSVAGSGVPERLRPGFWDNDGQCCGTAGVGEVFLASWLRAGEPRDLAFGLRMADALLARAVRDGSGVCWRFLEHRADEPLLPPGVGWMQGAAGISAFLFRAARVLDHGRDAPPVPRMDTWWSLPGAR